jgi:predicted DNA binding CopG/RHH family protein
MKKDKKNIPKFSSEKEERLFWEQNDSTDYLDWSKAEEVTFPNLKPSTKTISIRLPESLFNSIKMLANKKDMPYQSLMKAFLAEKVRDELQNKKSD